MLRKLIEWALDNPVVVIALALTLAGVGIFAFLNVNVEAYPDPAPAIVEVFAQFPGASAEEIERQVTIPLEVTFAGMPGIKSIHSKSLYGLSDLKMNWHYGNQWTYEAGRQEVINRISTISQPLPPNVTPQISPESPTGEIYRYVLTNPKDKSGREIYTLNDMKALQDWVMEREFRTVQRIVDVGSFGGTVRRYEVQPDPDRLRRYGVSLLQLQAALSNANTTVGGDYVNEGQVGMTLRSVGLFGAGNDPTTKVLGMKSPVAAAAILRAEEERRIREIRALVITSTNNQPVRVEDVVEGGRAAPGEIPNRGVVVSHQTRLGRIGYFKPDRERPSHSTRSLAEPGVGHDEPDVVECIVLLRKNEETLPALKDVKAKVDYLNDPHTGRLLPGVKADSYYDRTDLLKITTDTVTENLLMGVGLVVVVLFMFVNNIRTAIIVSINIPLALLFAFTVLYVRGKSANLLSIGAVDFGIIVDSSVIMVENIYRNLAAGNYPDLAIKERIGRFVREIDRALLFSTMIMVCAFIPLFTMQGPEGQLFAPMAQTYGFALFGALLLALTLTPVLCMFLFKNFKPVPENFLVRFLKRRYIWQLNVCLDHPYITVLLMACLIGYTASLVPKLGREFMPALEEGNLWIRGTAPLNISLEREEELSKQARAIMATYPEVESVVNELGRPDDGTDTDGWYNSEYFVPLRPEKDWPKSVDATHWWDRLLHGPKRARTKDEIITAMDAELERKLPGISWNFSQNIRDNVMEALSGIKGDNSVKIFGPDLDKLELLAARTKEILQTVPGIKDVGIFHTRGQSHMEWRVDPLKCQRWGVSTADVNNVVTSALGARALTSMVEGEKLFDISVRWPKRMRSSESDILDIPVDIINNTVVQSTGPSVVPNPAGFGLAPPSNKGSQADTTNPISTQAPRLRLRDLVTPLGEDGTTLSDGQFEQLGAATIYREQGRRLIAIKFGVRDRDLGGAVGEAQARTKHLFEAPYSTVWSGEFEEMEDAERRLMFIVPISLALIVILHYACFNSFMDAIVVLSNVFDVAVGGIWALYLTGTNFSVSAAVGFISLFGIAVMEGLLMISYFNALRGEGLPLREAITQGAAKRVRPVMITAMTAILGLLPAAVSTKIGSQTQKPLAIVVVGGMALTLFVDRYLMPVLYSFYGNRKPPERSGGMAH
jgi:cobalt-zinc-cadmium resistance protein CzcA